MPCMDKPSSDAAGSMDNTDDVEPDELMDDDDLVEYVEEDDLLDIPDSPDSPDEDDDTGDHDNDTDIDMAQLAENQSTRDDADCVFTKHTGAVFCCHLDPKTNTLAVTGSEDDKAYVWNTSSGEILFECTNHKDSVISAEFSHDGTYLATGDMSGIIQVWKVATKNVVWSDCIGDLSWLKWHPGTAVLLAAAASGEVYMWKIPSGVSRFFPSHGIASDCGLVMPDGRRAAFGYSDGSMRVYDLKSSGSLATFAAGEAHSFTVYCIDAHNDNNMVVTGGGDSKVVLYKTQPGKVVSVFQDAKDSSSADDNNATSWVEAVQFCPDPSLPLVAAGTLSGQLFIWDIAKQ
ncbi:angio-associated migratory cell protein isoform X2 [Lycorma delicatula]